MSTRIQTQSRERGLWAEQLALQHLCDRGLRPHSRNYRWRGGEIDLIMLADETVVFVEVRYRSRLEYGDGAQSVTGYKRRRIANTARYFLQQHPRLLDRPCRFDVVSISGHSEKHAVQWIPNAFDAG